MDNRKMQASQSQEGKRISPDQRRTMLEFMKAHPALATGKFTAPDGVKHKMRLLKEMTEGLNSCPFGVTKTEDKWMKSWQDWRSDVKAKAANLRKEMNRTGGGSNYTKRLTPLEEELLNFLGPNVVPGHVEVPDPLPNLPPPQEQRFSEVEIVEVDVVVEDSLSIPENGVPRSVRNISPVASTSCVEENVTSQVPKASGSGRKRPRQESSDEKLIHLSERQVLLGKEALAIKRKNSELLEKCADAFCKAMNAVEKYFRRPDGES